jgi:hypothetical protein
VPLEVLHLALVLLRGFAAAERAEVPALARLGIGLFRIEPDSPDLSFLIIVTLLRWENGGGRTVFREECLTSSPKT